MPGPIPVIAFTPMGDQSALNVTAVGMIKSARGCLCKIIPVVVGTAGNLTLNDLGSATAGVAAANEVITIPFGSLAVGVPVEINWPFLTGIALTAIPTGGQYSFSFN